MIVQAESPVEIRAAAIFRASLVTLYLSSTFYNLSTLTHIKEFFQLLDHFLFHYEDVCVFE